MNGFTLHLLRHGMPERPGLLLGKRDDAPTPAGIAACVAQARGLEYAHVIGSGLRRSTLAAQVIAEGHSTPVHEDPRWQELDFGAWDGLSPAQIGNDAMARFWDDPDTNPPPGGERWSSLVARVMEAVLALPPHPASGPVQHPVLVVTHGGAMRAALAGLCGFSLAQLWAFDLPYAALLSLRVWPGDTGERPSAQIIGLRA